MRSVSESQARRGLAALAPGAECMQKANGRHADYFLSKMK
jgi:hypothetical protein